MNALTRTAISVFLIVGLLATPAVGESLSETSLPMLIEEALANNRQLQAAKEQWEAVKLQIPQASALPDPMAGTMYMGEMLESRLGPQEDVYEFEQMIPFPGKLLQKRKMAQKEALAQEARYEMVKQEVIFKVSEAYYELFAVDASLQVAEQIRDLLQNMESIAQSRYASQSASQGDVAKTQTAVSETLQQIFVLRQERESLLALLSSLLNRREPLTVQPMPEPEVPDLKRPLEELVGLAQKTRPQLREARAMKEREEHGRSLAKLENMPDFSVGFQYIQVGEGMTTDPEDGRDAWMIPIKVTIPLWQNRIGAMNAEARRNLRASEEQLKEAENVAEYEIKNAYYQFMSRRQVVELYKNALIPQAELAFRSDQAGYEAGRTDILNLIDSERVLLSAKMSYYQALADALKNFAAMEQVIGLDLEEMAAKGETP